MRPWGRRPRQQKSCFERRHGHGVIVSGPRSTWTTARPHPRASVYAEHVHQGRQWAGRSGSLAREAPHTTTLTAPRASLPFMARRFRPDLREMGLFEGLGPDSWKLPPAHVEGLDASSWPRRRGPD